MSNIKISELPAAGELSGDELIPVVQDGETRKATVTELVEATDADGDDDVKISELPPAEALSGEELIAVVQDDETRKITVSGVLADAQMQIDELSEILGDGRVPAARTVFADADGDDTTGEMGNAARPYKTAQAAYDAVKDLATNSARYLLKLGVGSFNLSLSADWNQYVYVSGVGAELSNLTVNASGVSGLPGANGAAGANAEDFDDPDYTTPQSGDAHSGGNGADGGDGTDGSPGLNVTLTSDLTVALTVSAYGGGGGAAGNGGTGGHGGNNLNTASGQGGTGGDGGNGGYGGNGADGGTVKLTRVVVSNIYTYGGGGGSGGTGGYYGSSGQGANGNGWWGGYSESRFGASGGNGGAITLIGCKIRQAATSSGGLEGSTGSDYQAPLNGATGAPGHGGQLMLTDCADGQVNSVGGYSAYSWPNSHSNGGNGGSITLTQCRNLNARSEGGTSEGGNGGNSGAVTATGGHDLTLTSSDGYAYGGGVWGGNSNSGDVGALTATGVDGVRLNSIRNRMWGNGAGYYSANVGALTVTDCRRAVVTVEDRYGVMGLVTVMLRDSTVEFKQDLTSSSPTGVPNYNEGVVDFTLTAVNCRLQLQPVVFYMIYYAQIFLKNTAVSGWTEFWASTDSNGDPLSSGGQINDYSRHNINQTYNDPTEFPTADSSNCLV
ncbi:MAG: hypothetical protein LBK71_07620 [Verrucomicrobiales bacterium]|jgi:hypothetical protein|nr:hypothetical protein [Verrucomicrobiales bacterium]